MDMLNALLHESKFWTTLFLLVQAILFHFAPDFPKEIWSGIDVLVGVIIATLLGAQIKKNIAASKEQEPNL